MDDESLRSRLKDLSDAELFSALVGISSYRDWAAHWAGASSQIWYLDADQFLAPLDQAVASLQPQRETILQNAQQICRNVITGWGDVTISHGDVVDFNADYGEAGQYGFHYWDWSRPLLQAFLLTRDETYLQKFEQLFTQWYVQRDRVKGRMPNLDVIWYELGLARRSRVFIEFYALAAQRVSLQTHERMLKTLLGAARWLHEEQKKGNRLGNWQVMGSYALGLIALSVPEFAESRAWLTMAVDRLQWHLEKDFYPDGCHWERCPSDYMLTVYRDLKNLAALLAQRPEHSEQANQLSEPLKRSLEFYRLILPPDGVIPAINDGRRTRMPKPILDDLRKLPRRSRRSAHLSESGFTVLRDDVHFVLIDHGPMAGGHTHLSALCFELHAFGQPMFIDSGMGLTYDDPNHESWYRRGKAHNMLTLGDEDVDRKSATGENVIFQESEYFDYLGATHHGYEKRFGALHRRHIVLVKRKYLLIFDQVDGLASPNELTFHLHSPLQFAPIARGFFSPRAPGVLVMPANSDWNSEHDKGWAAAKEVPGFTTDHEQITWLRFRGNCDKSGRTRFAVLIAPFQTQPVNGSFEADYAHAQGAKFVIVQGSSRDLITIGDGAAGITVQSS